MRLYNPKTKVSVNIDYFSNTQTFEVEIIGSHLGKRVQLNQYGYAANVQREHYPVAGTDVRALVAKYRSMFPGLIELEN